MKKIITIVLCILFVQKSFADCTAAKQSATDSCSAEKIRASQAAVTAAEQALAAATAAAKAAGVAGPGPATTAQNAQLAATTAKAELETVLATCSESQKNCDTVCKEEQHMWESTGMNPGPAQQAADSANYCKNEEPEENRRQGQQLSSNLGQTLLGLAGLLASLGLGQGGDSQTAATDCFTQPTAPGCAVDTASTTPTATLASGTARESSGSGFDTSALNTNDVPTSGTPVAPSYASATPGFGGGGGLPMMPSSSGASSGKPRSVAEEPDGSPKINMPGGAAGGGRGGGGGGSGSGMANGKVVGNPAASRTGIDADKNLTTAAAEKAMQVRGLASEGPVGGISSAHSLDNFQKVEKRIETERTQLSEL